MPKNFGLMQGRRVQFLIMEQFITVAHDVGSSFPAQQLFQLLHSLCHAGRALVRGMGVGGDDMNQSHWMNLHNFCRA